MDSSPSFWLVIAFLIMILILLMFLCETRQNLNKTTNQDSTANWVGWLQEQKKGGERDGHVQARGVPDAERTYVKWEQTDRLSCWARSIEQGQKKMTTTSSQEQEAI